MCSTEGISTLLSTGSASTLKMVIERQQLFGYNHCVILESTALQNVYFCILPEELPEGFSQQMQEESQRSRPRFQPAAHQKPATPSPKAPINTRKETTKVSAVRFVCWQIYVCIMS